MFILWQCEEKRTSESGHWIATILWPHGHLESYSSLTLCGVWRSKMTPKTRCSLSLGQSHCRRMSSTHSRPLSAFVQEIPAFPWVSLDLTTSRRLSRLHLLFWDEIFLFYVPGSFSFSLVTALSELWVQWLCHRCVPSTSCLRALHIVDLCWVNRSVIDVCCFLIIKFYHFSVPEGQRNVGSHQ